MPAAGHKIVGTGACLTWSIISSSFQNSLKMSGHRSYEFLEFWCWNLVPIWTRLTIEHFSTLKQSILNEPWSTGHDGASGPCSHMASFLHDRALGGIF